MCVTYPYVHNLSANAPDEVCCGAQSELRARPSAALRLESTVRPVGAGVGASPRRRTQLAARASSKLTRPAPMWSIVGQPIRITHGDETGAVTNSRYVDPSCTTCTKADILGA
nr:MAG TPA: hypothetical protein [Caudoviricetes sp.]